MGFFQLLKEEVSEPVGDGQSRRSVLREDLDSAGEGRDSVV